MSSPCKLPDCQTAHHAKGWCRKHYRRWKRTGSTDRIYPDLVRDASVRPSVNDIHWAAGFIEGEGSFTSARVQVGQKDRSLLLRLQRLFGGSVYAYDNVDRVAQWCASGERARGVAMTLYPLLSVRRQKAIRESIL